MVVDADDPDEGPEDVQVLLCPTLMEGREGRREVAERMIEFAEMSGERGPRRMVCATVILPVKRFGDAKQRLLTALDRPQRAALVKAMLTDALVARQMRGTSSG